MEGLHVRDSVLSKLICKFSSVPIKIPIAKTILKRLGMGVLTLEAIKAYFEGIGIKEDVISLM